MKLLVPAACSLAALVSADPLDLSAGQNRKRNQTTGLAKAVLAAGIWLTALATCFAQPAVIQFTSANYWVSKTGGVATINAEIIGGEFAVFYAVDYSTGDGTATAGVDYLEQAGTLTFDWPETNKSFTIPILQDSTSETSEAAKTVQITLSNPTPDAVLGVRSNTVLFIVDKRPVHAAWVARLTNNQVAFAMKLDKSGNVYVTGSAGTVKYDNNGNQLWLSASNAGVALVLDDTGNVYVAGTPGIAKLGPNGEVLWLAPWNGALGAIALDGCSNVYVTGRSGGTAKYDSSGHQLWLADRVSGQALALDSAGNAYIAGYVNDSPAAAKLAPNGEMLWQAFWSNGYPIALAVDVAGNAYVTGSSEEHYKTVKYDTNGNQLWFARYSGRCELIDVAAAIALDTAGNVYVSGGSGISQVCRRGCSIHLDNVTVKYDASGNQLWAARNRTEDQYTGVVTAAIALDRNGNVLVSSIGFATAKYDGDGNQLWQTRYGLGSWPSAGTAIALDSRENVFVIGTSLRPDGATEYTTIKYVQTDLPGMPRITMRPQSQTVLTRTVLTLSVTATGEAPLTYQWFKNRASIPGATEATLTVSNLPPTSDFSVEVSNPFGMTASPEARVKNLEPVTLCCGAYAPGSAFLLTISGPPEASYQMQQSDDLVNWDAREAGFLTESPGIVRAAVGLGDPRGTFYRAVIVRPACRGGAVAE